MGGTKTQTTTQNTRQDPWEPAQPALRTALEGAISAYQSGVGSQVYQGPRTAGLGDTTQAGLDAMAANAGAGQGAAQAGNSYLTSLLQGGGATSDTYAATAGLRRIDPTVDTAGVGGAAARLADPNSAAARVGGALAGGALGTDASGLRAAADSLLSGPTQTQRSLQDVADGKFLGGANPWLDDMAGRAAGAAASRVGQQFAASGRYGSGRFAGAVADAVVGAETGLRYQDYEAERGRQAQAAAAIDAARNANAGQASGLYQAMANINQGNAGLMATGAGLAQGAAQAALSGQQSLAGLQADNFARQMAQQNALLGAAQADRGAGLSALGAVGANASNLLQPGQTLAGIGALQDAARQQGLDATRDVFDETQSAPWRQLGLLTQLAHPIGTAGSTGSSTGTTTMRDNPSLASSILGGITTGVGLLGQTGAFPTAAAGAASAGWMSSVLPALFALSDERAKEDIREVGRLHDGQAVYAYRYKGDPTPQIGLLAQEVAERDPGAVATRPDGLLAVDYDRATSPAAAAAASFLARPSAPRRHT